MYEIARLPGEEREILFQNTAAKMGMNAAIIEKDFWVCLTLDYLFHECQWKKSFAFKGGTSLSKVYHLIDRFSEDIDLILDWRLVTQDDPLRIQRTLETAFQHAAAEVYCRILKSSF